MGTKASNKRQELDKLIRNHKSTHTDIEGAIFKRTSGKWLWPSDLVGLADFLETQKAQLERLMGRHIFNAVLYAFSQAEKTFMETDTQLSIAENRKKLRPILALSVRHMALNGLHSDVLPSRFWLILSELAIIIGDIIGYLDFRSKALEQVKQSYKRSSTLNFLSYEPWAEYIRIIGESGGISMLRDLEHRFPNISAKYREIICCAELYIGNVKEFRDKSRLKFGDDEFRFGRFVEGKSIAIVGPVDVGLQNGTEIDSFDLVMRFNYNGLSGLPEASFGRRTDFSFYIENKLPRNVLNDEILKSMNQLQYVIGDVAHRESDKCFEGLKSPMRPRFPAGHVHANPLFKGTHNAIQRCITDLARFETGRIKIFNSDLFISSKYAGDYRNMSSEVVGLGFIAHDPVSNFHFTQKMLQYGLVSADDRLSQILEMTSQQYAMELHLRYGDPAFIS